MRKYASDIRVSENGSDPKSYMVERQNPDNFSCFPPQECCVWTVPEIVLKCDRNIPFFSFLFLRLVMRNYFIQVIWNYINDKN